jgi:hypothetical protein
VIALNKFMAFYRQSGILPTHVFFLDFHDNSLNILDYIFNQCIKDNLEHLTFIVHKKIKHLTFKNKTQWYLIWLRRNTTNFKKIILGEQPNNSSSDFLGKFKVYRIPKKADFLFTVYNNWLEGGEWSNDVSQSLYHYRGSLTSVLNYVAIIKPKCDIYLVGNDFNSKDYFFQNELKDLQVNTDDWTTPIINEHNRHFSAIEYEGKTIFDCLPFIKSQLQKSKCPLYCTNQDSLLVTKGDILYKKLPCI